MSVTVKEPLPSHFPPNRPKSLSESCMEDKYLEEFEQENDVRLEERTEAEGAGCEEQEKTESDQDAAEVESTPSPPTSPSYGRSKSMSFSVDMAKAHAFEKLQEELMKAKEALQLKDEQVFQLSKVRDEMDREIEELTANLFQEAHAMVNEANVGRAVAEKKLREASGKIDILQAEVQALKTLVITSTPSMPLPKSPNTTKRSLLRRSKNNLSHHRNHSFTGPIDVTDSTNPASNRDTVNSDSTDDQREVDPLFLRDLQSWREEPTLSPDSAFIKRVFAEDVHPCLNFPCKELSIQLQQCVAGNSLTIEPISGKNSFPRRCALTDQQRPCKYRIKMGDTDTWCNICPVARNRIAAVCDFYTYLRYIQQGLVKSDLESMYWEIIKLRKAMSLAKLGLP